MAASAGAIGKRESALAALILALAAVAALRPSIRGHDGASHYVYIMSLAVDGDLDFTNDYAAFDLRDSAAFHLSESPVDPTTGRPANRYGIGAALFWAPAVLAVHGVLSLAAPEQATGLSAPYVWAVGISSAFWTSLGLWLLLLRLRRDFSARASWCAIAGLLAATPLVFYSFLHGSMSHAVSFFAAVMAMLCVERCWERGGAFVAFNAGLWAGMLAVVRPQDATWTVALGFGLILASVKRAAKSDDASPPPPSASRRVLAWAALGLALALAPQMAIWNELYGSPFSGPSPYLNREAGRFSFWPRNLVNVLVSERGGVFAWHPILLVGAMGLASRYPLGRPIRLVAAIGLGLQIYLVSCWSMWWAGASFGNRFFISAYPFLALGLAAALERIGAGRRAWLAPMLVAALVVWNAGLLVQYGTEMIPREEEVGWPVVLRNQFDAAPRWVWDWLLNRLSGPQGGL